MLALIDKGKPNEAPGTQEYYIRAPAQLRAVSATPVIGACGGNRSPPARACASSLESS
jgi:hypothetical protein